MNLEPIPFSYNSSEDKKEDMNQEPQKVEIPVTEEEARNIMRKCSEGLLKTVNEPHFNEREVKVILERKSSRDRDRKVDDVATRGRKNSIEFKAQYEKKMEREKGLERKLSIKTMEG